MRLWDTAVSLAEQTPPDRNRYVDFLRAASIMVVVIGHWLIATAWWTDGELVTGHLLKKEPGLHWMTWIFQVMPIFFIVGGYANAVSLESAKRKGIGYAEWLGARINRLITPLLVLMLTWSVISLLLALLDTPVGAITYLSQSALIPSWFLAIYTMVVIFAPLTYRFWRNTGYGSVLLFAGLALLTDLLFFNGIRLPSWANYFWVWLGVHQLGYAWREGRQGTPLVLLALSVAGFVALYAMVFHGPYPMAMVGSPDEDVSNSLPPKAALMALGLFQFGLLLAIEKPMRRALDSVRLWAATVLVNSMIMSLYLWHITVMLALGALLYFAGGFGFGPEPGSAAWWLSRPLWVAVLLVLLVPLAMLMSPLERIKGRGADCPPAWRQIAGAVLICGGIALLAMWGYGGAPVDYLDVASFVAIVIGAGLAGLRPGRKPAESPPKPRQH